MEQTRCPAQRSACCIQLTEVQDQTSLATSAASNQLRKGMQQPHGMHAQSWLQLKGTTCASCQHHRAAVAPRAVLYSARWL